MNNQLKYKLELLKAKLTLIQLKRRIDRKQGKKVIV